MASSVFSETLQVITTTKLTELSKKRALFEKSRSSVLSSAQREVDQKERLRILLDGIKPLYFEDLELNEHADVTGLGEFLSFLGDLSGQMNIELDEIVKVGHAGQHFDDSAMIRLGNNFGLQDLQPFA